MKIQQGSLIQKLAFGRQELCLVLENSIDVIGETPYNYVLLCVLRGGKTFATSTSWLKVDIRNRRAKVIS